MKELASEIKKIIGLKAYNRFIARNPGNHDLRAIIKSSAEKRLSMRLNKYLSQIRNKWYIFFFDFYIPIVNYYFRKDRVILQKLIDVFITHYRNVKGADLEFWAQELDLFFEGNVTDLAFYFPDPEKTLLLSYTNLRKTSAI